MSGTQHCTLYSTAQFKLYTCMQVHVCACTFNAWKALKIGMYMHCCMEFLACVHGPMSTCNTQEMDIIAHPHYMCGVATGKVASCRQ